MQNTLMAAVSIVVALAVSAVGDSESAGLVALSKSVRPAVVKIVCKTPDGGTTTGTGFFISPDGQLVTSYHVVDGASEIAIQTLSGAFFTGETVLAYDEVHDIALLKVTASQIQCLRLADSNDIVQGTSVAVFGNPLGLDGTLTDGIISAVREDAGDRSIVQITAPISPGSSGSPVVSKNGLVVGLVAATISSGQSLNFAISAKAIRRLVDSHVAMPSTAEKIPNTIRPQRLAKDGWGKTKWGMVAADLEALFPGQLCIPKQNPTPRLQGLPVRMFLNHHQIGTYRYQVAFLFDEESDSLTGVYIFKPSDLGSSRADVRSMIAELKEGLTAKYGRPASDKSRTGSNEYTMNTWISGSTCITLHGSVFSPTLADIQAFRSFAGGQDLSEVGEKSAEVDVLYRYTKILADNL